MLQCTELRDERSFRSNPASDHGRLLIGTGKSSGTRRRLISIFLILALALLLGSQVASAEPAAITEAKSEAAALQARIDELADQLDAAVEDYNYAKAKLSETKAAAEDNQAKLAMAEEDLEVLQGRFTERVVEIYKQGNLGTIATLAEADSFSDLVNRLDLLERLSEQDSEILADVLAFKDEVEQRKGELAVQLEEEKVLTAETKSAKAKVEERLAANEKALEGKEAQIAQLQKEEAARQARLAAAAKAAAEKAAAAKKAKLAAAAAEKAKQQSSSNSSSSSGSSSSSRLQQFVRLERREFRRLLGTGRLLGHRLGCGVHRHELSGDALRVGRIEPQRF